MEKCATQIPFSLSHCGVPTLEKCGSMCELCTVMCAREKCASARVQVGVVSTSPSAPLWSTLLFDNLRTSRSRFFTRSHIIWCTFKNAVSLSFGAMRHITCGECKCFLHCTQIFVNSVPIIFHDFHIFDFVFHRLGCSSTPCWPKSLHNYFSKRRVM